MAMTTLPDRLLADDELLNRLFAESNNFALREDVRALMAEAHNAIVEAAALSGREAVEFQYRRGELSEWQWCSREEYEARRLECPHLRHEANEWRALYTTPQPGDVVSDAFRAVLKRYQDGRVFSNPHTRQVARAIEQEAEAMIAAAPSAKGVAS